MIIIIHRETGEPLLQVAAETLAGADLRNARLSAADLRGADLSGANLSHASLSQADLRGADLSEAWLWQANLLNADLSGADLRGALLLGAVLWGTALENIRWNARTQWPYSFHPSSLPGSDGESGSKGSTLEALGPDAILCPKGLHRMGAAWGGCPGCLQTLWSESAQARRRAATACAKSAELQARNSRNCQSFRAAVVRFNSSLQRRGALVHP